MIISPITSTTATPRSVNRQVAAGTAAAAGSRQARTARPGDAAYAERSAATGMRGRAATAAARRLAARCPGQPRSGAKTGGARC